MGNLILIKHAMPVLKENVSSNEWQLSEDGKEKSKLLGEYLKKYNFNYIYSSTEPKAIDTATIAGSVLSKGVKVESNLHEHERSSNRKIYPTPEFHELIRKFFLYPDVLIFGDETANIAKNRFIKAIHKILDEDRENEDIVIVTHGTVMTLFASEYNEINQFVMWDSLGLPSIIELSREDYKLKEVISKL